MADPTPGETGSGNQPPEPEGHFAGVPYDWRRPTVARVKSRWWNPDDRRIFTPKTFGWGWDLNMYWVTHPLDYLRKHQDQ